MKKSKLIALLNSIPGDPDVKLGNGFAGDWVDIENKLYPLELVKKTESYHLEMIRIDECVARQDWQYQLPEERIANIKRHYKNACEWEMNECVTDKDITEGRYKAKTVYVLQSKEKGVTTWDFRGTIKY